ncbi:MAG: preprotein translocase subunit SecE [Chlamydiota bacterium]|nr:preprotein translocase subunit SecE [Chlamydiota bacterium]
MANPLSSLGGFFVSAKQELQKVTWPTKLEIRDSTVVVIVCLALMATYIGLVDFVLSKVVELVIR